MNLIARASAVIGVATALLVTAAPGLAATADRPDWKADLAFLKRELPARHKNLFFQVDRAEFERRIDALEHELPQLDDVSVALRLQQIIVSMGDDHSTANWLQLPSTTKPEIIPLQLYWYPDGWRIIGTSDARKELLGRKLVALNGTPMPEVEARVATLISEHPTVVKASMPNVILLAPALRLLGLLRDDALILRTENDAGQALETTLSIRAEARREMPKLVRFTPNKVPMALSDQRSILWTRVITGEKIFYVQYNRCEGREVAERLGDKNAAKLPSLAALFDRTFEELKTALEKGTVDTLVFDVRHNAGGASDFGTAFAERVAKLPGLKEPGHVYVIIGRRTFSSAIINAGDFKRLFGAVLVGEPTSGTPNHYGETNKFVLPSSGLPITYSTKYFGQPGEKLEPFVPDVPAESSFADYRDGKDRPMYTIVARCNARRKSGP